MSDKTVFPSKEWFAEYQEAVNADEKYVSASEGWGVDFNGDFIFKMTDMPLDEIDVDSMPEDLQDQMGTYVKETGGEGHVGLAFVGLEDGECTEARLIESADEVEEGFQLTGPYDNWVELIRGNIGAVDGMMSGKFELDGDMQKILQYTDAATRLTEDAGSVDAVFAHEEYA
ncbi:MAG: SCP2 sterol-binding domain-containing protein [Haloarculaceae archaeon]